jgi:hypothetical protein
MLVFVTGSSEMVGLAITRIECGIRGTIRIAKGLRQQLYTSLRVHGCLDTCKLGICVWLREGYAIGLTVLLSFCAAIVAS